MVTYNIIEYLGFERAVSKAEATNASQEQAMVIEKLEDVDIDKVYFCDDEERSYPAVFIKEIKVFDENTLRRIAEIHNQIWNYKKVLFLYVYNDTEVRIYNCAEKPFPFTENTNFEGELSKLELERASLSDKKKLQELEQVFSAVAIDTGIIWTIEEAYQYRKQINQKRKVDKYLVDSLTNIANELHKKDGLNKNIIHKVILRSLFLLYLEDRGATDEIFYNTIKLGAKKYFEILEDKRTAYKLYQVLQDRFNGNVFTIEPGEIDSIQNAHLDKIRKCLTFGYENTGQIKLFEDWRLFNFKIISVELLSEIYENFIADLDGKAKKDSGTFYTPTSLVELILNEKLPVRNQHTNYNIKVLDPACGSGIFLVESFKRIVKRYENKHNIKKLTDFNKLKGLLLNNIYGIEIDRLSLNVAAFSLYLALLDNLEPKTLWQNKRLPFLIQDPDDESIKEQGLNLFKRDAIGNTEDIESIGFDLVVGNPPFGTKNLLPSVRKYCEQYHFAKESALPFLHKALEFSKDGKIALIFNTKVLTNTKKTYQNFRAWLFNKCYVKKVYNFSILRKAPKNFGGQLFSGATVPVSIVIFQKKEPEDIAETITYFAPKTFVKSNILDGIIIDKSDIKYLPREECKKPDTKIWKIAMWGGMEDIRLIKKLNLEKHLTVRSFIKKYEIYSGVGFQLLTNSKDKVKYSEELHKMPYIDSDYITRYYTSSDNLQSITSSIKTKKAIKFYKEFYNVNDISEIRNLNVFRRFGDQKAFKSPHIIVKKGLEDSSVCASKINQNCSFRDGVYGFYTNYENLDALHSLLAHFNSKFSTYFLFMTISSYGIEREQIMKEEYESIPINIDSEKINSISTLVVKINKDKAELSLLENNNTNKLYENVENIITSSLGLNERDTILIEDRVNINLDLFHKKEKSKALLPIRSSEDYATMLLNDLNDFLIGQNLYANATLFPIDRSYPLALVKVSFDNTKKEISHSDETILDQLKNIDEKLWKKETTNIYFRKHLNYFNGDDIYIIRPNQYRYWTRTAAMEDASELILQILTEK